MVPVAILQALRRGSNLWRGVICHSILPHSIDRYVQMATLLNGKGSSGWKGRQMADIRVDWNRLQSFTAAVFEHAGLSVEAGHYNPRPDIRIERETPATMLIEADRAFGPVVTTYAMKQAIANARGCPGYTTARSPSPYREAGIASSPWIWPPAWLPSASWKWPWTGASPSLTRGRLTRTANRRRTRSRPGVQNSFIGAIDIAAFTDPAEYRAHSAAARHP